MSWCCWRLLRPLPLYPFDCRGEFIRFFDLLLAAASVDGKATCSTVFATSNGCANKTELYRHVNASSRLRVWVHASLVVDLMSMSMSGNRSRVEVVKDVVGGGRALWRGCDGDGLVGVGPIDGGT